MINRISLVKLAYDPRALDKKLRSLSPKERYRLLNVVSSKMSYAKTEEGKRRAENLYKGLLHYHIKDRNEGRIGSAKVKSDVPENPLTGERGRRQRGRYTGSHKSGLSPYIYAGVAAAGLYGLDKYLERRSHKKYLKDLEKQERKSGKKRSAGYSTT